MVQEVLVREGDVVRAGQPLAKLNSTELAADVQRYRSAVHAAQARLAQAQAAETMQSIRALEASLASARVQLALSEADVSSTETDLQQIITLQNSLVSAAQMARTVKFR